jgi:hypothetical protein
MSFLLLHDKLVHNTFCNLSFIYVVLALIPVSEKKRFRKSEVLMEKMNMTLEFSKYWQREKFRIWSLAYEVKLLVTCSENTYQLGANQI